MTENEYLNKYVQENDIKYSESTIKIKRSYIQGLCATLISQTYTILSNSEDFENYCLFFDKVSKNNIDESILEIKNTILNHKGELTQKFIDNLGVNQN